MLKVLDEADKNFTTDFLVGGKIVMPFTKKLLRLISECLQINLNQFDDKF